MQVNLLPPDAVCVCAYEVDAFVCSAEIHCNLILSLLSSYIEPQRFNGQIGEPTIDKASLAE